MKITITIPDTKKVAVIDAFAAQYNYQEEVSNPDYPEVEDSLEMMPNPESRGQFALGQIRRFIKEVYVANQVNTFNEGKDAVRTTAEADMNNITIV